MESSSTNLNSNPSPVVDPENGAFPNDYWSGMGMLYPPAQSPSAEQPFGIGWDHPVFQGGHSEQGQPQSQSQAQAQPQLQQLQQQPHPHQPHQDRYSQHQQGWPQPQPQQQQQQRPLQPAMGPRESQPQLQQDHQLPSPYQMSPFRQSPVQPQVPFEPPPQPNHPRFQHYHFDDQRYYSTPPLPGHSGFPQQHQAQHQMQHQQQHPQHPQQQRPSVDLQVNQSPVLAPNSMERNGQLAYQHPDLQPKISQHVHYPPMQDQHGRPTYHQTINPQYLTTPHHQGPSPAQQPLQQQAQGQPQQGSFFIGLPDLDTGNYQGPGGPPSQPQTIPPQYLVSGQGPQPPFSYTQNGIALAPKPAKPAGSRKTADPATKSQKASTKKAATKATLKPKPVAAAEEPNSESDSSDSSDDEEEPESSPLPAQRPEDVEGRTQYDTMKIVWSPRNKQPLASEVRNSMASYSDLVKAIRDTWRTCSEALKAAENKNQEDQIPALKKDVALQRRLIDLVIDTTLDKGHPSFYRTYGEHPMILSGFYSFLLDRHTAADNEGPLTLKILKTMAKFTTMDQEMLEKTKNDRLLTRFVKKGGDTIKQLAQTILDNAAAATKAKDNSKASSKENSPAPSVSTAVPRDGAKSPPQPGVKRAREAEDSDTSATKKTVTSTNGKSITKPATAIAKKAAAPTTQATKSAQNQATASKAKPNMVTPKPTPNLFSSLMSASKKPGTSNAARAAAAAKEKTTSEQTNSPPASQPPRPAFSFSETLADLGKPKEPAPAKAVEEQFPPETEDEKKKRLRKEERRKLRVKWKPDESLTEVRHFTHDPEEEIGHEDSMMRDVDNVAGEGRMLKMHRDFDDLDDEEEGSRDETFFPYTAPSAVDFDILGNEQDTNYTKSGGKQEPDSPEKRAQEQREANTLSAFYASPADVPISPKEPPAVEDEPYEPEAPFGEPDDKTKARSDKYFAAREPRAFPAGQQAQQQAPTPAVPQVDISSLLRMLQPNQHAQQTQPTQQPQPQHSQIGSQPNLTELERTFSQFRNPQIPPAAPLSSQPPQAAATPGFDFQNLLAIMSAQNQTQQPQAFQPPPPPTQAPNLASILAQFSKPGEQQQPQQQQGYDNRQDHSHGDSGKKRVRDGSGVYDGPEDSAVNHTKRFRGNGDGGKPKKHPKAGSIPCRYWKEGKCIKGDDCTFRHDPLD